MFKYLAVLLCLTIHWISEAQLTPGQYTLKKEVIGQRFNATEIYGKTFRFSHNFYDAFYDSTSNRLFFSTRAKDASGKVYSNIAFQYCLDVETDSILWTNEAHKFDITKTNDYLFFSNDEKTTRFNKRSGFEQYDYPSRIFFTDARNKLGFCFNKSGSVNGSENLKCIYLEDGNVKWMNTINRDFDWNEIKYLNDSILLIASGGLHGVNLKTGDTWSHPLITGDTQLKKFVFSPIAPESSTLGKDPFLSSPLENVVTQLSSNILIDQDRIYLAGKDNLICVNTKGELLWRYDLTANPASKSFLYINGNDLSLFNLGVASFKDRIIEYGKPFLTGLDKLTGKVSFNQSLSIFSSPVDFRIMDTTLFVATREKMYQFNIANGNMMYMLEFNEQQYGRFTGFIDGDKYYVEKEGFYVSLNFINDKSTYFKTDHGKVYGLEKNEILYEYQISELFELDKKTDRYRFLNKKDESYVVSPNWELLARLKTGSNVMQIKNKIYYPAERKLHIISLNDVSHEK